MGAVENSVVTIVEPAEVGKRGSQKNAKALRLQYRHSWSEEKPTSPTKPTSSRSRTMLVPASAPVPGQCTLPTRDPSVPLKPCLKSRLAAEGGCGQLENPVPAVGQPRRCRIVESPPLVRIVSRIPKDALVAPPPPQPKQKSTWARFFSAFSATPVAPAADDEDEDDPAC